MIVAGIDPGKSGALFVDYGKPFDPNGATVPLLKLKVNGKKKTVADFPQWARDWGNLLLEVDHVFIEQVGAMPGQGVTSMFTFGYAAGFAYGLVLAANLPHTFVTPQKWKKFHGLSGSDGDQSRRKASQLMPAAAQFWPNKGDHGVAEAALIAYYGRAQLEGKTS